MRVADFNYELPAELIAQAPLPERSGARLLSLEHALPTDRQIRDLPEFLRAGDVLVINDTRVIPARLFGHKASGGRVEMMLERLEDAQTALVQLRASKSPGPGARLLLEGAVEVEVVARVEQFYQLRLISHSDFLSVLQEYGHVPLPPYIAREDQSWDRERYQTVYATHAGAVAAPTAGLHFDQPLLERVQALGVTVARVTLHVGAGTFQPVKVTDTRKHIMHAEYAEVSAATCATINDARARGGRVIAVGTTSMRSLESAAASTRNENTRNEEEGDKPPHFKLQPFQGETRLFITPGFQFRVVDRLLTNFHLPQSTLMMLVTAFGGYRRVMDAYAHAVAARYRFFSYGDAMWLAPGSPDDLPPNCSDASPPGPFRSGASVR